MTAIKEIHLETALISYSQEIMEILLGITLMNMQLDTIVTGGQLQQ
jgi:hypothetical protein